MNIILINNNDTDGVGQHFSRAVNQLNYIGHKAVGLVVHKKYKNKNIIKLKRNFLKRSLNFLLNFSKKKFSNLFSFGFGGVEYSEIKKYIQNSDLIIIYSFFNIISLKNLEKILSNHENVIFRPLDLELISGGCHVNLDENSKACLKYKTNCSSCPQLNLLNKKISSKILLQKKKILNKYLPPIIVENSYTQKIYKSSSVGKKLKINKVFLGINSNRAKSISKFEARKKLNLKNKLIYITYGSHILKAKHKGGHLINSIFQKFVFELKKTDFFDQIVNIKFLTFGNNTGFNFSNEYINNIHLGLISQKKLNYIYRSSDLLISPATFCNGPHIVSEATLNNLPIVSFDQGIAEDAIMNGMNGYKTQCFDIQQFAKNMIKVLFYNNFKFNNKSIAQLKKSYNSKYEIKKILSFSKLN